MTSDRGTCNAAAGDEKVGLDFGHKYLLVRRFVDQTGGGAIAVAAGVT